MTNNAEIVEEEKSEARRLLPFWAQELLAMNDEAEKKSKKVSQLQQSS